MGTEQTIVNGTRISMTGRGPLVVLIHGVFMDRRMWESQVAALSPFNRVCCLDMLGHGDSLNPLGDRALADFVEQVHQVIEFLSEHGKPVLGGFSMGGLVSQAYAIKYHASLRGLMLLNTVYQRSASESNIVEQRLEGMLKDGLDSLIESASDRWFTNSDWDQTPREIETILGWMRDGAFQPKLKAYPVFARGDKDTAGKLNIISCPALVMTGEHDRGSTPLMAKQMAESIPDSRLQILKGHRHMMPVLGSNLVNSLILDFLREIENE